ncbi:FAD:protein FMN transferase [Sphingomicrobium nitratireducens]|uniref:FAD:protein FMN transferase n=1 Tax=Sphingomicrobium nitratireducens TaxID=2964666 RepID=UPI0022400431|nr:FAD:protein FMN transferase [Sphingomicrobium nitratireducens]
MRRARPLLGTFVTIESESEAAIAAGFAAVERIHALMSAHEPESELSRLNRSTPDEPIALSPDTLAVLTRARFWFEASDGAFDPVRAGARAIADGAIPLHAGQPAPDPEADFSALTVEGTNGWLARPATIDLGGIAKGYAVDRALDAMRTAGAREGFVNAGGDMASFGAPQPIVVTDPLTGAARLELTLDGRALATSAAHEGENGPDARHLPGSSAYRSVTVEAARAIDADALTKIAWSGHGRLADLFALADARAVGIAADGRIAELAMETDA